MSTVAYCSARAYVEIGISASSFVFGDISSLVVAKVAWKRLPRSETGSCDTALGSARRFTYPPPMHPHEDLLTALDGLLCGETDPIANAANTAAAIWQHIPDINWAGFYILRGETLVLGPFQGRPACIRIPLGVGVCGAAAQRGETIVVPDVHAFPGHIACDAASNAEIVVPLIHRGALWGVLDIDSPSRNRFGPAEQTTFEAVAARFMASLGV